MEALEAVKHTLDILSSFSKRKKEQTIAEISSKINLPEADIRPLLEILEEKEIIEYLERNSKYKLTHNVYYIGHVAGSSLYLRDIAYPVMEKIRDKTNQTVNLYLLRENYRICIEQCKTSDKLEGLIEIGESLPLWTGASGKVLLAFQTEEFQKEIFRVIPPEVKIVEINEELQKVREQGYYWEVNVRNSGYSAIAFPIYDVDGKVIASISISGPTGQFTREFVNQYETYLKEQCLDISKQFGFREE
ncbi:IclR family transcriptional regulator [Halalkalibacter urbisdiaboli]|uniref:IclR family transcriptional regulator n=1 Tax=Halalkalibacter urbisdiaboli TaxID=1960589 RepID=UPI000B44E8E7|nr:IclR family transcriptional regulator [Halalkalibacter urbisdiaboli]